MNIEITYSRQSQKFIIKNSNLISEETVEKLLGNAAMKIYENQNITIDLKQLKGKYKGMYRIRKGKIRIIFSIKKEAIVIIFVSAIDFRGNIY